MQEMLFTGITLAAIRLFILIAYPCVEKYRIFYAGIPTNAVVCGRKEKTVRGKKKVKLIWKFTYEGKEREYISRYWQSEDEKIIGYRGAILLRKNNVKKIYEFMPRNIKMSLTAAGIIFVAMGMILITAFFYMRGTIELLSLK